MKNIFLDTNFIIDCFVREEYKHDAEIFLNKVKDEGYSIFISYLSIANFAYILRKIPKEQLYQLIHKLTTLFNIVSNDEYQIRKAIELSASDFEDALQYAAAITSNCECIITRNEKDFNFSEIPVMSFKKYSEIHF